MNEWNFMSYESKDNLLRVVGDEFAAFTALTSPEHTWEAPTACVGWEVRDQVGHMLAVTEGYFVSFDAARGHGQAPEALGLAPMAAEQDERAKSFRGTPQPDLLDRLQTDFSKIMGTFEGLTTEDWSGLMVPHGFMGPLPACFYPVFQLIDYTVHSWDIGQGTGQPHGISGDAADLLVPLCFIYWQATCRPGTDAEPVDIGVRVTSGANAGDTRVRVGPEGLAYEAGSVADLAAVVEFDPASLLLSVTGRFNGGTTRGDRAVADRFRRLFFKI